jgi:iron complex outermembrane receptor protein
MLNKLQKLAWMTGLALVWISSPVLAQSNPNIGSQQKRISRILDFNDTEQPATNIKGLLSQGQIQITDVKLQATEKGIEVFLATNQSEQLQLVNKSEGNNYIVDIPNSQLRLSSGEFRQEKPLVEITEVSVTNLDANTIRIKVTGEKTQPQVELFDTDEGLILGVAGTATSAQLPETPSTEDKPTRETEPQEPIELVVTGEQEGYRVPNASTATRTDTPLRDVPRSIQVIPDEVLKDQSINTVTDAIRNVSSVVQDGGFGGTTDQLNIRGFYLNELFTDGFRNIRGTFSETANIERIEVLKGPASILFGNVEPGGIINLVTKQPLSEPYFAADLQVGSFGFVRPTIDLSGPLTADKSVLYRLNAAFEGSDGFRDFDQNVQRYFIAPVVKWNINDATAITFEASYLNDERPFDRGLVAIGRGIADIPVTRILGEPDDFFRAETLTLGYRLEHQFNDNLQLRNIFQYRSSKTFDFRAQADSLNEETGILSRTFNSNDDYVELYGLQTNLTSKFKTGSIQHNLTLGIDLARQTGVGTNRQAFPGVTPGINIFDPEYNLVSRPARSELGPPGRNANNRTDGLGIFLQDQIALADNLKFLIGGRLDFVEQNNLNVNTGIRSEQSDTAFSPQVGVVYQPIEPISLFANYARSFGPNSGTRVDNSILDPERGTQYEVGVRGELFNRRLTATLSAYHITKSNIATTDPNNPDFSIPIGKIRSQGIELDVVGEILPGWNIIGSYGLIDSEVTAESFDLPAGSRNQNTPRNTASLWTTYRIQSGDLQGLGFGTGLFYVGERAGDFNDTFDLPSYLRTDAAIFYQRDNWRAAINIQNLFDVRYFKSNNFGREAIEPGAPFTIIGSLSVNF